MGENTALDTHQADHSELCRKLEAMGEVRAEENKENKDLDTWRGRKWNKDTKGLLTPHL